MPATSVQKLKDGEVCRIPWPSKEALLAGGSGSMVTDWREGVVVLEARAVRLDGYAVPFPHPISALQVMR
jgi:hypothetical protein